MEDAESRKPLLSHPSPPAQKAQVYETLFHYSKKIFTWHVLKIFILSQVLCLFMCGTSVNSQILAHYYLVDAPLLQNFICYCLLFLIYTVWLAFRLGKDGRLHIMKNRWWKYLLIAILDVEGNYAMTKAYQFTNIISIQLLASVGIPVLMVISWFILRTRYRRIHFIAIGICLLGVWTMVGADVLSGRGQGKASALLIGDVLVILGSCCFACCDASQEYVVKNITCKEYLGMLGLFGTFISGIQLLAVERSAIANIEWEWRVGILFAGYALCLFGMYSVMTVLIRNSSAMSYNLGILNSDIYSMFFGIFLFGFKLSGLYILAFGMIIVGFIMYCSTTTYSVEPPPGCTSEGIKNNMKDEEAHQELSTALHSISKELSVHGLNTADIFKV